MPPAAPLTPPSSGHKDQSDLVGGGVTLELPPTPPNSEERKSGRISQPIDRPQKRNGTWPPLPQDFAAVVNLERLIKPIQHTGSHPIPPLGRHEDEIGESQSPSRATIRSYAYDCQSNVFPRISKPVELMRNSYDCVVIGSGYGGGVAASRMARATGRDGRNSVCVLERGKERWPGEYPSSVGDCLKNLHISGQFSPSFLPSNTVEDGDPTGMYHLIFGNGLNAVVGNGLGGTSLMNANVFLRADEGTMSLPVWPKEIRDVQDCLGKYYDKAEAVLEPAEYPDDWPELPKVKLFKEQAERIGMKDKFRMVPQTTRFKNGPNSCGVEMSASALTGQDATGINDGSKTTTLVTYLADAWNWGADMFCECEVRYITKCQGEEGGYIIHFAWHGRNRDRFKDVFKEDLMWVHAKKCLFLGAGSIGTTEILLRSREMGLPLSDLVGQNMSGNGDMLAFGYNTDFEANGVGKAFPKPYNPTGPTINSMIDNRDGHENPLSGWVIQEGAIPSALAPLVQAMLRILPGRIEPKGEDLAERFRSRLAEYGSLLFGPYFQRGAMDNTQVYLVMSHDCSQAMLTLKDDKPVLEFIGSGGSDHVSELHRILAEATQHVGGTFVNNPFYALMGKQQITVHPIGGACMSRDNSGTTGVTNHAGEVFSGNGEETHPGLIVMDGAIVPAALGVNPFATITALAERSIDHYAKRNGLTISEEGNGILDLFGAPKHPLSGLGKEKVEREENEDIREAESIISDAIAVKAAGFGFTEVMAGYLHRDIERALTVDKRTTYERAYRTGKGLSESARFFLSVQAFDTKSMVEREDHPAMLTGTFVCPTIPGSPFMVQRGDFNLFIVDKKAPGTRNLTYDFDMVGTDRQVLHFHGYKVVDSSVALSLGRFWKSTTTLYVTVTKPDPKGRLDGSPDAWRLGEVVARGILRIRLKDFLQQTKTMAPTGSSFVKRVKSAACFFHYFTRQSMSLLLGPFAKLQYPTVSYNGYINDTAPDASFVIQARDGVKTRMHMWQPTNPKIETKNLFMIPGASVDHHIFALPTIPYNAVNYLTRAGYRVFVTVHRIGQLMVAQNDWTTYDAREDIRACLQYIRDNFSDGNTNGRVYTIAHCMGSVALSAGMLNGDIPADWILGLTCSQVFMNPIWNTLNMIKVMAGPIPLDKLYKMLAGTWFSCSTSKDDIFIQRIINELLRFYPDERKEICNNASCHRCSFVFGRCWNHYNLNEATHRQINRFFGGVNMTLLHLLMKQGYEGHVMGNAPAYTKLTTDENMERLRGIPFLLWVGGDNAVLSPASTERTYETLCNFFGSSGPDGRIMYRRRVVPGYGHLDGWMGRNAWKDVYPFVRAEVDRVVRGEEYKFVEPKDKFALMIEDGLLL